MKIIEKYKTASPAVKASMALLMANMVLKGLSMISGPIFTRLMSTDEYGIVSTFTSWQSMLGVLVTFNLASGVFNNGMLDFKEDRDSFQFSILIISSISALVWFLLYILFSDFFQNLLELPHILICFMFLYFLVGPAYQYWSGRQRYEYKYKLLSFIIVGMSFCSIVLGIVLVLLAPDESKAIYKVIASESVFVVVGLIFYIYIAYKAKLRWRLKYCKYALKFNIPLIPHYLSMYALAQSDRVIITKIIGTGATAIYSVAYTVAAVINIFWQSVDSSLSPWIYENLSEGKHQEVKKIITCIILIFSVLCLGCTLFSPEIMAILSPSSYHSGIYVIPSVSASVFFTAVYSLYMRVELYFKQTKFSMVATTIAAILNIVLNFLFIPVFGFIAAGFTTMVSYLVLYVLHYFNVRNSGYSYIFDNRAIALISLITVLGTIGITFSYQFLFARIALIIILGALLMVYRKKIIGIFKRVKTKKV